MRAVVPHDRRHHTHDAAPTDDTPDAGEGDLVSQLRAEAAKYRTRLRAAEKDAEARLAEHERLRERVADMQRQEVERHVADKLGDPSDLWLAAELDDLLDEEGGARPGQARRHGDRRVEDEAALARPSLHRISTAVCGSLRRTAPRVSVRR